MRVYVFFLIALFMAPIVCLTYRVKNRYVLWVLILLPPCLIAPLALVPYRNPLLGFVWIPVLPFLLGSVIALIYRIIAVVGRSQDKLIRIKSVRPLLTIAMFAGVLGYHRVAENMADQYTLELAQEIQAICDANGACPIFLPDWEKEHGDRCSSIIRKLHIPYKLIYSPSVDGRSFVLRVRHAFDRGMCIDGGVNTELVATYRVEGRVYRKASIE